MNGRTKNRRTLQQKKVEENNMIHWHINETKTNASHIATPGIMPRDGQGARYGDKKLREKKHETQTNKKTRKTRNKNANPLRLSISKERSSK